MNATTVAVDLAKSVFQLAVAGSEPAPDPHQTYQNPKGRLSIRFATD